MSLAESEILLQLFNSLPTSVLAYSVRGASVEWRDLIDKNETMQQVISQRCLTLNSAAQKQLDSDPFYPLDAISEVEIENKALAHCLTILAAAQLKWDCEHVFREHRQATLQPLQAMQQHWQSQTKYDKQWTQKIANDAQSSLETMQMRILHDCNDELAEQYALRVPQVYNYQDWIQ